MFDGKPTIFVVHEEVIKVKGEDPVQRQVLELVHDPVFKREGMTAFVLQEWACNRPTFREMNCCDGYWPKMCMCLRMHCQNWKWMGQTFSWLMQKEITGVSGSIG